MNANGYLTSLSELAFTRELERANIDRSLASLQSKIELHFTATPGSENLLKQHFAFGSYTRGTMLPRSMDLHSDIDYIIVFADSDLKPQAYLDRLRRFAEASYPRRDVAQSSPTIVLTLNHIKFELAPAIEGFFGGLKIPTRSGGYQSWMDTEPNAFNSRLTGKNKENENLIKPLVRVLKYWNACNEYPFESFELEQQVVDHDPWEFVFSSPNLWQRFRNFVESMDVGLDEPGYKKRAVLRAKRLVALIKGYESRGDESLALLKLALLLPPVATSA